MALRASSKKTGGNADITVITREISAHAGFLVERQIVLLVWLAGLLIAGVVFARFVVGESLGVTASLASEWFAKWTSDRSIRGRYMPDRRTMRPPGVSKRDHYG